MVAIGSSTYITQSLFLRLSVGAHIFVSYKCKHRQHDYVGSRMLLHALGIRWKLKIVQSVEYTILLKIPLRKLSFSRYSFWWKMRLTRAFARNWKYTLLVLVSALGLYKVALSIRIRVLCMNEIKIELLRFCVIVLGTRLITIRSGLAECNAQIREALFYL